ncbi:glycoside hydrolase family 1 protein [Rhodococcus spelaei]|uniref:glycoside hydrolase family 1 protein n=1 Tax=Rhodococcus spelaei TaxID=2546320 RepID=UPI0015EF663A|nr:family 1 glycosylhydrolase [Rhodococcus spelaei]
MARIVRVLALVLALVAGPIVVAGPAQAAPAGLGADFEWGVATSGFQAEGPPPDSNWSRYIAAGKTHDPYGPGPDFLHRYPEDIANTAAMGVKVFRFSVEWARVQPTPGAWDESAFAYYDDVVRQIRSHGMKPMITLDHFVYPGWIADRGGWGNDETVGFWLTNAEHVIARYAGVGADWITINEPTAFALKELTFGGISPLGVPLMTDRLVRAHRGAYDLVHRLDPGARVSSNVSYIPAVESGLDATFVDRVRDKLDFIGVDYYYGVSLDNLSAANAISDAFYDITPQPDGIYHAVMHYAERYPGLPIYIVENGMPSDNGKPRADGYTRSDHLRDHVYWLTRAKADGANVIGYNYWSITDNYEWGSYRNRFGLYTVDVLTDPTLTRRPTDAVAAYRDVIAANGVPADYRPVMRQSVCSLVNPPQSCLNPPKSGAPTGSSGS